MRKMTIALVCAGALFVAACGDDGGDDADDTAEDTADEETADDTGAEDGDDTDAPAADTEFCQEFRGIQERFADQDPEQGVDEAMDELEEVLTELRTLDAPDEISDEWETYLDGLEVFTQVDLSDPEAAQAAQEEVDQEALQTAAQTVESYVIDDCGIDLNA